MKYTSMDAESNGDHSLKKKNRFCIATGLEEITI